MTLGVYFCLYVISWQSQSLCSCILTDRLTSIGGQFKWGDEVPGKLLKLIRKNTPDHIVLHPEDMLNEQNARAPASSDCFLPDTLASVIGVLGGVDPIATVSSPSTSNQPLSSPVPVTVFGLFLFLFAWRLCSLGHTYFKSWHHFPNSVGGTWTYGTSAGQAPSWGPFIIASITIHPLHRWSLNYCVVI